MGGGLKVGGGFKKRSHRKGSLTFVVTWSSFYHISYVEHRDQKCQKSQVSVSSWIKELTGQSIPKST